MMTGNSISEGLWPKAILGGQESILASPNNWKPMKNCYSVNDKSEVFMKLRVSLILTMFLASIAWQRIVPTSAVFGDVPTGHLHKLAIDYVQATGIVSGYPDATYQPDRLLNRAEFTKIIVESRSSRLEIDNCRAAEGFYKRSLFSDVASAVWYEKYVCVGRTNDIIGGYPDGTFRGEQTINYAEAAKIIVNSYGLRVASRDPWFAPFLEKLTELNALPPSLSTT